MATARRTRDLCLSPSAVRIGSKELHFPIAQAELGIQYKAVETVVEVFGILTAELPTCTLPYKPTVPDHSCLLLPTLS